MEGYFKFGIQHGFTRIFDKKVSKGNVLLDLLSTIETLKLGQDLSYETVDGFL